MPHIGYSLLTFLLRCEVEQNPAETQKAAYNQLGFCQLQAFKAVIVQCVDWRSWIIHGSDHARALASLPENSAFSATQQPWIDTKRQPSFSNTHTSQKSEMQ
jgi:hypothetical protein